MTLGHSLGLACLLAGLCASSAPAQDALGLTSPPKVLADGEARRCRALAGRRAEGARDSISTVVETAGALLELETVYDAVATCRAALRRFPGDPSLVIAHANAADMLMVLAIGIEFPGEADQQLARLRQLATEQGANGLTRQMLAFAIGSAHEHGLGTPQSRGDAARWYAVAADTGSAIARRELERLQRTQP